MLGRSAKAETKIWQRIILTTAQIINKPETMWVYNIYIFFFSTFASLVSFKWEPFSDVANEYVRL